MSTGLAAAVSAPDWVLVVHSVGAEAPQHLELTLLKPKPDAKSEKVATARRRLVLEDPANRAAALLGPIQELRKLTEGRPERLLGLALSLSDQILPRSIAEPLAAAMPPIDKLREPAPTLAVVSNENWIPWEILALRSPRAGEGGRFVSEVFALARWRPGASPAPATLPLRQIRLVVPEGSKEIKTDSERAALLALSTTEHEIEPAPATYRALLQSLSSGEADGWHFSGHGQVEPEKPELSGVRLEQYADLLVSDLSGQVWGLGGRRPLVFLNACHTARGGDSFTGLSGLAEAFLKAQAGAFIGAWWAIPGSQAKTFAVSFYQRLFAGASLGEAARQARLDLLDQNPEDLTRLAYAVFGDPLASTHGEEGAAGYQFRIEAPSLYGRASLSQPVWKQGFSPPGALLRAEYGVVPFHGRERELEELREWALAERPAMVRLYTGAGGMGKTRLAFETCLRLRQEGWRCGFMAPRLRDSIPKGWEELFEDESPLLLVIDYAEHRRDLLVPLLKEANAVTSFPVRVLLLARAAADWWDQLKAEDQGSGGLLSSPATRKISLPPLAMSRKDRARSYEIAGRAFAKVLEKDPPEELPEDIVAEHFERVLLLHMTALAKIEDVPVKGELNILDFVLNREALFWAERARLEGVPSSLAAGLGRAMAMFTLGGGVYSVGEGADELAKLPVFADQPRAELEKVASLLHQLYPGLTSERYIEPILPDLLGEHLVQRELEKGADELFDLVLGPRKS